MKFRLLFLMLLSVLSLFAQPAKVKNLEKEKESIVSNIKTIEDLQKKKQKIIGNALKDLNLHTQKIQYRHQLVEVLSNTVNALDEEIERKKTQILSLENELIGKKQDYALSVQKMYEYKKKQNELLFILSGDNFAQCYRRMMYMRKFVDWQKEKADEIVVNQQQITIEKQNLETQKKEKENALHQRKQEETLLIREENTKRTEIESLKKDQRNLQAELAKQKKKADALNKQIEKVIAEDIAASQKASKTSTKEKRTADSQDGYAMTKEEKALSSNFAGNKGKLPFPIQGKYKIVEYFGHNKVKEFANVYAYNYGIDIESVTDRGAKAVFDGVVSSVTMDDYLYAIIIRHGNYLTVYANLQNVNVKKGDKVKTGQSLGKIATEKGNAIRLHFEVWEGAKHLNPLQWLNK